MKSRPISWVAVATETALCAWSRKSGAVRTAPRPATGGLSALLSDLPSLVSAGRKDVGLLLLSDIHSQTVRIPERQSTGLAESDLRQLLAFEAEPFSQIASGDAAIAWSGGALDDTGFRSWEIVELSRSDTVPFLREARRQGLAIDAFGAVPAAWRDIGDVTGPEAASLLAGWADDPPAPLLSAAVVAEGSAGVKNASGDIRQAALAASLLLCLGLYLGLGHVLDARKSREAALAVSAQRVTALREQVDSVRRQADEVGAASQRAEEASRKLDLYRGAWASLLHAVSEASAGGAVIRSIDSTGPFSARLEAYCTDPDEPVRFLETLSGKAAEYGWTVRPDVLHGASSSGLARFSFIVELTP